MVNDPRTTKNGQSFRLLDIFCKRILNFENGQSKALFYFPFLKMCCLSLDLISGVLETKLIYQR